MWFVVNGGERAVRPEQSGMCIHRGQVGIGIWALPMMFKSEGQGY